MNKQKTNVDITYYFYDVFIVVTLFPTVRIICLDAKSCFLLLLAVAHWSGSSKKKHRAKFCLMGSNCILCEEKTIIGMHCF